MVGGIAVAGFIVYKIVKRNKQIMGEAENINNIIKENTQAIKDITDKSYATKIKRNSRNNINGALLGGGIGMLIGVASRQNFYITGLIGLIIGRLFITNLMKK